MLFGPEVVRNWYGKGTEELRKMCGNDAKRCRSDTGEVQKNCGNGEKRCE